MSPAGISSLTCSLNGEPDQVLHTGPEIADVSHTKGRLAGNGDFNMEINRADLMDGANTVEIKAFDTTGVSTVKTVAIQHVTGNTWPLPYIADGDR